MESFPFDSKADGYDADGYPVYDRAVGAQMFRTALGKIFTNGVFGTPADALQIGKGTTGLTVTVQPGIAVINGAMGGVDGEDPLTLTLDTASPQGNVCYGIMLRYDNTDERRSLYFNVVRGDASSTPQPPTPDTTTPEVYEIRLGYVTVPSNATDLSEATVVNEKGTDACPYAMPFEEVDLSQIVADAQATASEGLESFNEFLSDNRQFVQDAIDGTTAGNLQNQINELKNNSVSPENVDNSTLEFSPTSTSQGENVLRVKDAGITAEKMADGSVGTNAIQNASVTNEKLAGGAVTLDKMNFEGGVIPQSVGGTGKSYSSPVFSIFEKPFDMCLSEYAAQTTADMVPSGAPTTGITVPQDYGDNRPYYKMVEKTSDGSLIMVGNYLATSSSYKTWINFVVVSKEGVSSAHTAFMSNDYASNTFRICSTGLVRVENGFSSTSFYYPQTRANSMGNASYNGVTQTKYEPRVKRAWISDEYVTSSSGATFPATDVSTSTKNYIYTTNPCQKGKDDFVIGLVPTDVSPGTNVVLLEYSYEGVATATTIANTSSTSNNVCLLCPLFGEGKYYLCWTNSGSGPLYKVDINDNSFVKLGTDASSQMAGAMSNIAQGNYIKLSDTEYLANWKGSDSKIAGYYGVRVTKPSNDTDAPSIEKYCDISKIFGLVAISDNDTGSGVVKGGDFGVIAGSTMVASPTMCYAVARNIGPQYSYGPTSGTSTTSVVRSGDTIFDVNYDGSIYTKVFIQKIRSL